MGSCSRRLRGSYYNNQVTRIGVENPVGNARAYVIGRLPTCPLREQKGRLVVKLILKKLSLGPHALWRILAVKGSPVP